jgi:kynureninase
MITTTTLAALDAADPLAHCRERFHIPDGVLYFDGNSLGALPRGVSARMKTVVEEQWGEGLIRSWNTAGWIDLAARVGLRIGRLVGAEPGSIISADSTSVNLFKLVCAALALNPGRPEILSDTGNFPTDLYVASGAAQIIGREHRVTVVSPQDVEDAIGPQTAVVMLTQVDYRTGLMHDMERITARAHAAGALVIWDLAHSAGALPVDLAGCKVDLAVGCSYKYLNGGPGAPAWLYVAPRHHAAVHSPLTGWLGHAAPFAFDLGYRPADGVARFVCGTPNILSLAALDASLDAFDDVDMRLVRAKSVRMGDLFIALVEQDLADCGFKIVSPRDGTVRGSQVSLAHPQGYAIMQALIARGVIGDFRAPDVLRFGFCPLYARFADLWGLVRHLQEVMATDEWNQERFLKRARVT